MGNRATLGANGWIVPAIPIPQDIVHISSFGGVGDGVTDDSAALTAAMAALSSRRGGIIEFDAKPYLFLSTIRPPYVDHAQWPQMKPLKFQGSGAHWSGSSSGVVTGSPIIGGTTFDLRGGNQYGKIQLRGLGLFESEGITYTNLGTSDAFPIIHTTNTTLHLTHNAFMGHLTKYGSTCDQDAIILGGTVNAFSNTETAGFQGYGTVIDSNFFERIRRGVHARVWSNSNVIRHNTAWVNCGNALAGGAFIDINGDSGASDYAEGNIIDGNLIEMFNYTYAISLIWAKSTIVIGNAGWDGSGLNQAVVFAQNSTYASLVIGSVGPVGIPYFFESTAQANGNTYIGLDSSAVNGNIYKSQMGTTIFTGPIRAWPTTVAALTAWNANTPSRSFAFATNGRKAAEGAGAGTGCPAWFDGTNWRTFYDNSIVAA